MSEKSNNEEERLLAKIRKLFALSENAGATGSEAETALRMANTLLDKHKIDKHKLREEEVIFASFCDYPNTKWVGIVCNIIGSFYNCKVLRDYNWTPAKTLIIGTSVNRLTAVIVIDQLIAQIKHEIKGKSYAYINGVVFGLQDKCEELLKQRRDEKGNKEVVPGTGLTVIDIDKQSLMDADDFMRKNFNNLMESKTRKVKYDRRGREFGRGLGVEAQGRVGSQKCLN